MLSTGNGAVPVVTSLVVSHTQNVSHAPGAVGSRHGEKLGIKRFLGVEEKGHMQGKYAAKAALSIHGEPNMRGKEPVLLLPLRPRGSR